MEGTLTANPASVGLLWARNQGKFTQNASTAEFVGFDEYHWCNRRQSGTQRIVVRKICDSGKVVLYPKQWVHFDILPTPHSRIGLMEGVYFAPRFSSLFHRPSPQNLNFTLSLLLISEVVHFTLESEFTCFPLAPPPPPPSTAQGLGLSEGNLLYPNVRYSRETRRYRVVLFLQKGISKTITCRYCLIAESISGILQVTYWRFLPSMYIVNVKWYPNYLQYVNRYQQKTTQRIFLRTHSAHTRIGSVLRRFLMNLRFSWLVFFSVNSTNKGTFTNVKNMHSVSNCFLFATFCLERL